MMNICNEAGAKVLSWSYYRRACPSISHAHMLNRDASAQSFDAIILQMKIRDQDLVSHPLQLGPCVLWCVRGV